MKIETIRGRVLSMGAALALAAPGAALAADRDTAGSPSAERSGSTGSAAEVGTGAGGAAGSTAQAPSKELREGLEKLHAANQSEIQGGKLAQKAAASSDVKSFAQKMVTDHTQADRQLTTMAKTMGVSLEGEAFTEKQKDAQKMMGKVQGKTGADFDKAYMSMMVEDHEKDTSEVKDLAKTARDGGQAELAALLDQTAQVMDGHLTMAKQIEQTVKSQKSTAASGSSSTGSGGHAGTTTGGGTETPHGSTDRPVGSSTGTSTGGSGASQ